VNSTAFAAPGQEYLGSQSESFIRDVQISSNTNLKYSNTFNEKHNLNAYLFLEYNKGHYKSIGYNQEGYDALYFAPGTTSGVASFDVNDPFNTQYYIPGVSSGIVNSGLFSYFGSVDYDYDERFGLGLTGRRDASFRFSDENKWGTFWSISGRWNISNEKFMQGSVFNLLKLRGSIGTSGNQNIVGQNMYNGTNLSFDLAAFGGSYANLNAYSFAQLGNSSLRWETIKQTDIGVDFELFNRSLRGVFDVYDKRTVDLYQSVPLSAVTGTSSINANNGSLQNRGVELQLAYDVIKSSANKFKLTILGNAAYNENKITALPQSDGINYGGGLTTNRVGDMLNQFYVIRYAGVNPANGNLLFLDVNGTPTENPNPIADRVYTGKSAIPKYTGSFGFDASYKGFYLNTQFTFAADVYRYDQDLNALQDVTVIGRGFNVSNDLTRAWTPTNRVTDIPALAATNTSFTQFSDRYIVDASYLRLRNVMLGYTFPKATLERTSVDNLKIFCQAENYFTWSKWRGRDAESTRGLDNNNYPTSRAISLGVEIQF
jgi:TonB-linked SusC/RagA family outer membrane protein